MIAKRAGASLLLAGLGLASFLVGLAAAALRTGRVDPLDWLWPALAVAAIMAGYWRRGAVRPCARAWLMTGAMLALPPLAFIAIAATRIPLGASTMLAAGVGLVCLAGYRLNLARGPLWPLLILIGLVALLPAMGDLLASKPEHDRAPVLVLSGPPLFGADVPAALGTPQNALDPATSGVTASAPFWAALSARMTLRPVDALDERTLAGARALLLIQPRLLQPGELVALDGWVRQGGHAVILADPLLAWPDARPLGNLRRPPLTSLLDPLLGHWGLTLEPARMDGSGVMEERRFLASGHLLNLVGASHFRLHAGKDARCALGEGGLIADCRPGKGRAILIADADFIEDRLWTIDPDRPERRAAWISDAVPLIDSLLTAHIPESPDSWLIDGNRLFSGICLAAFLVALLAALAHGLMAFPMPAHKNESEEATLTRS